MKIETYEIEEIKGDAGTMAADSEAIELCQKLGLEGQLTLANTETDTRQPYPLMTAIQFLVFEQVCPIKTPVDQYRSGIIPLRVLQVVAYCRENRLFSRLEVWHPQDAKLDPILVGVTTAATDYNITGRYLLARWAEVWKDFDALVVQAKTIWKAKRKAALKRMAEDANGAIASLDTDADEAFETGKNLSNYYSVS